MLTTRNNISKELIHVYFLPKFSMKIGILDIKFIQRPRTTDSRIQTKFKHAIGENVSRQSTSYVHMYPLAINHALWRSTKPSGRYLTMYTQWQPTIFLFPRGKSSELPSLILIKNTNFLINSMFLSKWIQDLLIRWGNRNRGNCTSKWIQARWNTIIGPKNDQLGAEYKYVYLVLKQ